MQRLFAEGHVLGLHSGSARGHVSHRAMESSELAISLADGMADIASVTGEPPFLVRPPLWAFSSVTLDAYRQSGLSMILTDISDRDGGPFLFQANPTDGGTMRNDLVRFRERLRASQVPLVDGIAPVIVTFHDTNNYTAAHLSDYLATLVSAASDVGLGMADLPYYNDRATLLEAAQTSEPEKEAARITGMLTAMVDGYWLQALLYPKVFRAKAAVTACLDFLRLAIGEETAAQR